MSLSTQEQIYVFHAQDRKLFSKLIIQFSRPPAESLLIMATWFWLEDFGFRNIFSIIMALPDPIILALANEAVSCFQCLASTEPPKDFNSIPLTTRLMKKDISLQILYKHQYSGITGIKNFLNTVCSRIFSDILQQVLPSSSSSYFVTRIRQPLIVPGFPHPVFGSINVMPDVFFGDNLIRNNMFLFPNGLWGWHANCNATKIERTLFLTFSRGFSVSQAEVKELFTSMYGENCVEGVYMKEYNTNFLNTKMNSNGQQQTLFARLVLDSVATVDSILKGEKKQKLKIYGKHVWARKFEERDGNTCNLN